MKKPRKHIKKTKVDNLPQLGLGSFLGDNIGNIAQTIGGAGLMFIPGGQAAGVGMMASGVGGFGKTAVGNKLQKDQDALNFKNNQAVIGQNRLAQYNANNTQQMIPTFANGGSMVDYGPGSYLTKDYWPKMAAGGMLADANNMNAYGYNYMAAGGKLPEGNATLTEAKEFIKLYPEEMAAGREVEYEHTGNKKLADRIAADHIKDHLKMTGGDPGYYKGLQQSGVSDELNKMPQLSMAKGGSLSPDKAKLFLKEGLIHGKALTEKQKKYFGLIASGETENKADGGYFGPSYTISGGNKNGTSFNPTLVTNYQGGGSHQDNPLGGIPIGNKARVESGEVRYDDSQTKESYVFSNRIPYIE